MASSSSSTGAKGRPKRGRPTRNKKKPSKKDQMSDEKGDDSPSPPQSTSSTAPTKQKRGRKAKTIEIKNNKDRPRRSTAQYSSKLMCSVIRPRALNKPPYPKSIFVSWKESNLDDFRAQNPDLKRIQLEKLMKRYWKDEVNEDERKKYEDEREDRMDEYRQAVAKWKDSDDGRRFENEMELWKKARMESRLAKKAQKEREEEEREREAEKKEEDRRKRLAELRRKRKGNLRKKRVAQSSSNSSENGPSSGEEDGSSMDEDKGDAAESSDLVSSSSENEEDPPPVKKKGHGKKQGKPRKTHPMARKKRTRKRAKK